MKTRLTLITTITSLALTLAGTWTVPNHDV